MVLSQNPGRAALYSDLARDQQHSAPHLETWPPNPGVQARDDIPREKSPAAFQSSLAKKDSPSANLETSPSSSPLFNSSPDKEYTMLLQPETQPISQEKLVNEAKGIYTGLVMVEKKRHGQ